MKKFYFLSGLPRSGSTLLSAILNQNPNIYASPTSGLFDIMGSALTSWYNKVNEVQGRDDADLFNLLKGLMVSKYSKINKPIIFDKSRSWTGSETMRTMSKVLGEDVKIIATVRNVAECAASFLRVANPKDKENFLRNSQLINHLKESYATLYDGYSKYPNSIHFVIYDNLIKNPKKELEKIHKFLGLEPFNYEFDNIDGSVVKEKDDDVWNIPNLHDIKPKVKRQNNYNCQELFGDLYDEFNQDEFWLKKQKKKHDFLGKQVELATKGKFEESFELLLELEKLKPTNNRVAFNKGWFLLRNGHLLEGHKCLDRGRIEKVYGNNKIYSNKPIWDGKTKGIVLLVLEGGLGDQIQYIRHAKDIIDRGCSVVVSCSEQLMDLFRTFHKDITIINHKSTFGIVHDFWVPSMSAIINLGFEYEDISGEPYIKKYKKDSKDKFRVGLRWRGNPNFLEDADRTFPTNLMFKSIKNNDIEFISLQRDVDTELKPDWVKEVNLETWIDTQKEISNCDLVITSCTSIAHLSGAMGIPTWVVVPLFPYYTWCLSGEKTPYYDSVRVFRQEKYGNWAEPFEKINTELTKLLNDKKIEVDKYLLT